jgi:hypothetical protein
VQNEESFLDYQPFEGLGTELMGPEQLAAMGAERVQANMGAPQTNMQRPALVQEPEGVDVMFGRRGQVMNASKGDRIIYRGLLALNEKPPVRPYTGMSGVGLQADQVQQVSAPVSNTKYLAGALMALGAFLVYKRVTRK